MLKNDHLGVYHEFCSEQKRHNVTKSLLIIAMSPKRRACQYYPEVLNERLLAASPLVGVEVSLMSGTQRSYVLSNRCAHSGLS